MSESTPRPAPASPEAADLVAIADRLRTSVRHAAAWRYVSWLVGMAVATVMYLAGLGVAAHDDTAVLAVSLVFGACVAVLSVALLPGARVTSAGFTRRWARAVLAWGLLYGASMLLGLLLFRGELLFWIPAGVVAAVPLALGARAEARS